MNTSPARRHERATVMTFAATPNEIFVLLCPVREYDWIPHWQCEMRHSVSGVAEKDCCFTTSLPGRGPEVWICTRYEPPHAIEYVRWSEAGMLTRLTLTLAADGERHTRLVWNTARTALNSDAEAQLDALENGEYERETAAIEEMLGHYLQTGRALSA